MIYSDAAASDSLGSSITSSVARFQIGRNLKLAITTARRRDDLIYSDAAKIPVCTTPGVNHHSVAEHTIALLMAIARGFPELDRKVAIKVSKRKRVNTQTRTSTMQRSGSSQVSSTGILDTLSIQS